ncbi:XdhC family protein [Altericroceibacterium xinjiangense]|uniref:XdhC family protein n=1 Tax=Altericroceibacterium xinjiangense TaxID=762261 RepID=UPI000F7DF152|nr:XdhC family protein [Altericroceibacterium xinjiangense]
MNDTFLLASGRLPGVSVAPVSQPIDRTATAIRWADDRAALRAACAPEVGLCTIVGMEGSFSRRMGAQLAVHPDGSVTGSLADGCLERQLVTEIAEARAEGTRPVKRFGRNSPLIDFRLPCGSGLDILIDPEPDRALCRDVAERLDTRQPAALRLPVEAPLLRERRFIPALRLQLFGEGPEPEALAALSTATGLEAETHTRDVSLGQRPQGIAADPWTAIVLLFHDHEWEQAILEWALDTPAFYIGAQGGRHTREERLARLSSHGIAPDQLSRILSPIGVTPHSREPAMLALSVLAQIAGEYEALHPAG